MHCTHNNALYHMMKSDARSITTSHASGAASNIDNENSMRDIRRHVWKIYRVIDSCCVVMELWSILLSSLLSIVEEEEDGVDSNGCFWLMNFVAATAKANTMRSNIFSQRQIAAYSSSNLTFHSALSHSSLLRIITPTVSNTLSSRRRCGSDSWKDTKMNHRCTKDKS